MSLLNDIQDLIPSKSVDVYGKTIIVHPLTLLGISNLISSLSVHVDELSSMGITLESLSSENENGKDNVIKLLGYLTTYCPNILTDITGIDVEVFNKLPFEKSLEIIMAVIDVNFESKDTLLKNLTRLIKMVSPEKDQVELSKQAI